MLNKIFPSDYTRQQISESDKRKSIEKTCALKDQEFTQDIHKM